MARNSQGKSTFNPSKISNVFSAMFNQMSNSRGHSTPAPDSRAEMDARHAQDRSALQRDAQRRARIHHIAASFSSSRRDRTNVAATRSTEDAFVLRKRCGNSRGSKPAMTVDEEMEFYFQYMDSDDESSSGTKASSSNVTHAALAQQQDENERPIDAMSTDIKDSDPAIHEDEDSRPTVTLGDIFTELKLISAQRVCGDCKKRSAKLNCKICDDNVCGKCSQPHLITKCQFNYCTKHKAVKTHTCSGCNQNFCPICLPSHTAQEHLTSPVSTPKSPVDSTSNIAPITSPKEDSQMQVDAFHVQAAPLSQMPTIHEEASRPKLTFREIFTRLDPNSIAAQSLCIECKNNHAMITCKVCDDNVCGACANPHFKDKCQFNYCIEHRKANTQPCPNCNQNLCPKCLPSHIAQECLPSPISIPKPPADSDTIAAPITPPKEYSQIEVDEPTSDGTPTTKSIPASSSTSTLKLATANEAPSEDASTDGHAVDIEYNDFVNTSAIKTSLQEAPIKSKTLLSNDQVIAAIVLHIRAENAEERIAYFDEEFTNVLKDGYSAQFAVARHGHNIRPGTKVVFFPSFDGRHCRLTVYYVNTNQMIHYDTSSWKRTYESDREEQDKKWRQKIISFIYGKEMDYILGTLPAQYRQPEGDVINCGPLVVRIAKDYIQHGALNPPQSYSPTDARQEVLEMFRKFLGSNTCEYPPFYPVGSTITISIRKAVPPVPSTPKSPTVAATTNDSATNVAPMKPPKQDRANMVDDGTPIESHDNPSMEDLFPWVQSIGIASNHPTFWQNKVVKIVVHQSETHGEVHEIRNQTAAVKYLNGGEPELFFCHIYHLEAWNPDLYQPVDRTQAYHCVDKYAEVTRLKALLNPSRNCSL